jgi:hypothetical protein
MSGNKFINNQKNTEDDEWHVVGNQKRKQKVIELPKPSVVQLNCESDNFDDEKYNLKKVLCNNILNFPSCNYGSKCLYAHTLHEQKVEPTRKRAYDMIINDTSLIEVDLSTDSELYRTLLQLTKVCDLCIKKICPGGYNCKYGVYKADYQICSDDLKFGTCKINGCKFIHLTSKGLLPMYPFGKGCKNSYSEIVKNTYTPNNFPAPYVKYNDKIPEGTLLTHDFFVELDKTINNKSNDSDYDSDGSVDRVRRYLDEVEYSDDSCDESIFILDTKTKKAVLPVLEKM